MARGGSDHERLMVCTWVELYLTHASSAVMAATIDGIEVAPIDVGGKRYAVSLGDRLLYRVGVAGHLELLDEEFHDSSFSVALRDALERALGGADLHGEAARVAARCEDRLVNGDLGSDCEDVNRLCRDVRAERTLAGESARDTGAGTRGWVVPVGRRPFGVEVVIPEGVDAPAMIRPAQLGTAAGVLTAERLREHGLNYGDAVAALSAARRGGA